MQNYNCFRLCMRCDCSGHFPTNYIQLELRKLCRKKSDNLIISVVSSFGVHAITYFGEKQLSTMSNNRFFIAIKNMKVCIKTKQQKQNSKVTEKQSRKQNNEWNNSQQTKCHTCILSARKWNEYWVIIKRWRNDVI